MKTVCFVILLLASSNVVHASTAQMDGNELLDKCHPFFSHVAHPDDTTLLNEGYCAGYVMGVTDVEAMWKAIDTKAGTKAYEHYCMPEEVNNGQILKILKKWLDNNPEKLHWRADTILHVALLEAFPCK
jgi:hypothetical protein